MEKNVPFYITIKAPYVNKLFRKRDWYSAINFMHCTRFILVQVFVLKIMIY